jgi:hypothetical protein
MTRSLLCLFAIAMFALVALPARGDDAPKKPTANPYAVALKTLADKGLTKQKATPTSIPWVLPDDAKVAEKLAPLRKAELAHRAAAKKVKDLIVEVAKDRDALAKAEAHYQEIKVYADKPDSIPRNIAARFRNQQEMQQALQADINAQVTTINELRPKLQGKFVGEMPPILKTAITDWMAARNNLIIAYLAADKDFGELDGKYQELEKDPEIIAALKVLGKKYHLGSAEYEQDRKAIAATESKALTGEVPFYREGSYDYVGALLNETTPVIVRIESVNAQSASWAPTEVLTKAGITIDPKAPVATLTFNGNGKRTIQCRQVIVPKLRLGKYVLENLPFLAMPDDAKDLGMQIVNRDLKGYDQTPDQATWTCKFVKQGEPAPEESKPAKAATPAKPDAK